MYNKSFGIRELNLIGAGVTPTLESPGVLNINATNVAISTDITVGNNLSVSGVSTLNSGGIEVTGVVTATSANITDIDVSGTASASSFRTNSTVGDGSDLGFAIKYYITNNDTVAYRFAGPGLLNTTNNPTIHLHRGFTYIFENSTGESHPFQIQFAGTSTGVGTFISGSQTGTQIFTVPHDAPASYEYQCTIHSAMLGTLNVVS